jgi:hypothetical protein
MVMSLSLLVDPAGLSGLVADNVAVLEPESNLLLGALDGIGAVADVSADIDGEVTADGAGGGGQRVGGAKEDTASLDGITALPDHGANGARVHVLNQTREEGLASQVGIVLLEVLLAGSDKLDGDKLVASILEARDDGADQATLDAIGLDSNEGLLGGRHGGVVRDVWAVLEDGYVRS